jgi:dephospho-CoA kinase
LVFGQIEDSEAGRIQVVWKTGNLIPSQKELLQRLQQEEVGRKSHNLIRHSLNCSKVFGSRERRQKAEIVLEEVQLLKGFQLPNAFR